jgi:hypothetical protein
LAQIKAMRLANVQTFGSNVWRPNIKIYLRADRFLAAAQIEKWSFFMCSCVISQSNHDFGADTQIKKKNKMVIRRVPSSAKENNFNTVLCVSAYLLIF